MDKITDKSKSVKNLGIEGVVVGVGKDKTIKVKVTYLYRHPLYRKAVKRSKNYLVHSEEVANLGDKVRIVETKPISKRKYFKLLNKVN